MQGATTITSADALAETELLHHRLSINVNFHRHSLRGTSTVWVRKWCLSGEGPPTTLCLHCRQCRVESVQVNGSDAKFEHLDPLVGVVRSKDRDAETYDLLYRSELWKAAGHDTGELCITVPTDESTAKVPDPPGPVPSGASGSVRARLAGVRGLLHMEKRRPGETLPGREGYVARYFKIEVVYTLEDPQTGLVWRHSGNVSGAPASLEPHCHTTYFGSGVDPDGPRCWFPCLDHVSVASAFEVELKLSSPSLVPVFSGMLLEHDKKGRFLFCTDAATTARGVGLAIGPFKVWFDPSAPRMKAYYLENGYAPGDGSNHGGTKRSRSSEEVGEEEDSSLTPFGRAVAHTMSHMLKAVRFVEEWLDVDYPFGTARVVFVAGMPCAFAPFGGLLLLRSDFVCHSKIPESDLLAQSRLVSVQGLVAGWVQDAIRLKGGSAKWIHHGITGYICERWVEMTQGAEEAQYRQWRAMREVARADQELGSPSINPPDPDAYILDSLDPALASFTRVKANTLMHMLEARIESEALQLAFRGMMRALSDEVKRKFDADEEDTGEDGEEGNDEGRAGDADAAVKMDVDETTHKETPVKSEEKVDQVAADASMADPGAKKGQEPGADSAIETGESGSGTSQPEQASQQQATSGPSRGGGECSTSPGLESSKKPEPQVIVKEEAKPPTENVESQEALKDAPKGDEDADIKIKEEERLASELRAREEERAAKVEAVLARYEAHVKLMSTTDGVGFLRTLKQVAIAGGNDTGPELTEIFNHQWICGQGVAFFRCGVNYNRRTRQLDVVLHDVMPPWQEGYRSGGPITVEVWEVEGRWKYTETVKPGERHVWSFPVHSKPRRRKKGYRTRLQNTSKDTVDEADGVADAVSSAAADAGGGANTAKSDLESVHEAREGNQSPILWVKIDPKMRWVRRISMRKPEHQWITQLFSDTRAESQADALYGLAELPLPSSSVTIPCLLVCRAMGECLRGRVAHTQEEHAACIRCVAAESLALWQNLHAPSSTAVAVDSTSAWRGLKHLFTAFNERFTVKDVLLPNWFDDSCHYRVKKALIWSIGCVRARNGCSPSEVCRFLTGVLRDNDNSENSLADDYYIAQCLVALGQLGTASESGLTEAALSAAFLETQRWLKRDKLLGSHNGVITACALYAACELELLRGGVAQVPYASYASRRHPASVRIAAAQCVVRLHLAEDDAKSPAPAVDPSLVPGGTEVAAAAVGVGLGSALRWTLNLVGDPTEDPRVREGALTVLMDAMEGRPSSASFRARFQSDNLLDGTCDPWCSRDLCTNHACATGTPCPAPPREFQGDVEVAEKLWKLMTTGSMWDQRVRVLALQVYESIWGFSTPPALLRCSEQTSHDQEWKSMLERAVCMRVQDWIMYRPTRREAPLRDWLRWHHTRANGLKYPTPDPKGQYGPPTKEGMLEQGELEPLTAPRLTIKLKVR
jgi:hypothetical protein